MATTANDALLVGKRMFSGLEHIYIGVWADEDTPATTFYNLVSIVADTTTVEQDDNEVNAIEGETQTDPLYEKVTLGARTFSCECVDFQNTILKQLFGWQTDESGNALAPNSYKDLFVTIEMGFDSTKDIVVLPKVKLNSKTVLSSMKTDASRGTISGTCYSAYVKAGTLTGWTDIAIVKEGGEYTIASTEGAGE